MQSYCTEMRSLSLQVPCVFVYSHRIASIQRNKNITASAATNQSAKERKQNNRKNREKPSKARKKYCCDEREKQTNSRDKTFVRRMQHAAIFRQMCQLSVVNHLIYLRISSDEIIRRFRTTNDWSIAFSARTATKI